MKIFYGSYSFLFLTVITLDLFGTMNSQICVQMPEIGLVCVPNPDVQESTRLCFVQVPLHLDGSCSRDFLCPPCPCGSAAISAPCPNGTRADINGACRQIVT